MGKTPWRVCATAALAGLTALGRAAAQPVTPMPLAHGEIVFVVHSTIVGAIQGRAPVAEAEFTGEELRAVRGLAVVRVAEMQTGNGTRDRHLRRTMEADSFPTIRFELEAVEPASGGDTASATFQGRLTIHGVTRSIQAPATVILRPGEVDVVANFPLDMRDYGIKPPVRALVLRVAPDVTVTARLSFSTASRP